MRRTHLPFQCNTFMIETPTKDAHSEIAFDRFGIPKDNRASTCYASALCRSAGKVHVGGVTRLHYQALKRKQPSALGV